MITITNWSTAHRPSSPRLISISRERLSGIKSVHCQHVNILCKVLCKISARMLIRVTFVIFTRSFVWHEILSYLKVHTPFNKWNKICFIIITHFNNKHNTWPWSDIRFIAFPVLLKAQNLFQSEFSRVCYVALPLINYSVFHFPYSHFVADYVSFLIFPSILSFCQKRILERSYTPGNAISIPCDRWLFLYKERKRRRK